MGTWSSIGCSGLPLIKRSHPGIVAFICPVVSFYSTNPPLKCMWSPLYRGHFKLYCFIAATSPIRMSRVWYYGFPHFYLVKKLWSNFFCSDIAGAVDDDDEDGDDMDEQSGEQLHSLCRDDVVICSHCALHCSLPDPIMHFILVSLFALTPLCTSFWFPCFPPSLPQKRSCQVMKMKLMRKASSTWNSLQKRWEWHLKCGLPYN